MPSPIPDRFPALVARAPGEPASAQTLSPAELPPGELTIAVRWSSLNYKDALGVTAKGKIFRSFPMVPGIDLAGEVLASDAPGFGPGDEVVVTGWGLGESRFGGYAGVARVPAATALRIPAGLGTRRAMAVGTAGVTAALCVDALVEAGLRPGDREVIVTGAAGGVGSLAVALLARAGFKVAASTGRPAEEPYLRELGAARIVPRAELAVPAQRPLDRETWAGGVDAVGGTTLATVLRQTVNGGAVAACGLAGGADLPTTVHPFILRGVRLLGVESVTASPERRARAWERLTRDLAPERLDALTSEIGLAEVPAWSERILAGQVRGRVVVRVS